MLLVVAATGCADAVERQCRQGSPAACGAVADREYHAARGADLAHVCALYRQACDGGVYSACGNLGALLGQRRCAPSQPTEPQVVLERACEHDDPAGCNNLGVLFRDGAAGAPVRLDAAKRAFHRACALGAAAACDNLGALLFAGNDAAGAAAAFQSGCPAAPDAANRAAAACCYKLGLSYQNGWGLAVDERRALTLFERACDAAIAKACFAAASLELRRDDAAQKRRAAEHFRRACEGGDAAGCNDAALMYANGIGVARDGGRAAALFRDACDRGDLRSCANLGSRYLLGDGVDKDVERGRRLIDRACRGGVAEACAPPAASSEPPRRD